MRVEPFEPPRLWSTPGRAALWNAFISHTQAPLPLAVRGASLRFAPASPPEAARWAVSLLPENAPHLIVIINDFPFQGLFGTELTAADLPDLPATLRQALVEGMVAFIRDALPKNLLGDIKLLGFGAAGELAARAEPQSLEWFNIEIEGLAGASISLTLGCPREPLLAALLSRAPSARPVRQGLANQLTRDLHVTLGTLQLTPSEIRSALVPGALVVFPTARKSELTLRSQAARYHLNRIAGGWTCQAREALEHIGRAHGGWSNGGLRPSFAAIPSVKEPDMSSQAMPPANTLPSDQLPHNGADQGNDDDDPFADLFENLLDEDTPQPAPVVPAPIEPSADPQNVPRAAPQSTQNGHAELQVVPSGLQLNVDFDLGSISVPLAELESWQPGAVLALDLPVPGRGIEVTIRVNGFVIGSGDLVTIDERPAVRIVRLALEG